MTEVFLLGTFHFIEKEWDVYSTANRQEISKLVQRLAIFCPDAVAVEGAVHQQAVIDAAYDRVNLSDFENESLMRATSLGDITMYGRTVPITWNNECIQIGFRLAKMLDLPRVHAVDADMELNDALLGETLPQEVGERLSRLKSYIRENEGSTLLSAYRCLNSPEYSRLDHSLYLAANTVNTEGSYNGSAFTAQWYERNLRIFSEIQSLSKKHRRIFVLYGAGHLQILRDLIHADDGMKLISLEDIL